MKTKNDSLTNQEIKQEISALQSRKEQLLLLVKLRADVSTLENRNPAHSCRGESLVGITRTIAKEYDLSIGDLMSTARPNWITEPRQIIFFIARRDAKMIFNDIARAFKKDHGTVIHGERAVSDRMSVDARFEAKVQGLRLLCSKYTTNNHYDCQTKTA